MQYWKAGMTIKAQPIKRKRRRCHDVADEQLRHYGQALKSARKSGFRGEEVMAEKKVNEWLEYRFAHKATDLEPNGVN
jgi:hypothetical protein